MNYSAYQNLVNYVDSLIRDNKKITRDGYQLNVDDLHDSDKEEFAAHLIDYHSYSDKAGWDWILDDAFREDLIGTFTQSILAWRKGEREELEAAFITEMKKSAVKTHLNSMQNWIDDRIGTVESEDDEERRNPSDCDDYYQEGCYA